MYLKIPIMSLTKFLTRPEVKEKFAKTFVFKSPKLKSEIRARPQTDNHSMVETAFDYLLRFHLERLNPGSIKRKWVAELAVDSTMKYKPTLDLLQKYFDYKAPRKDSEATIVDKITVGFESSKINYENFLRNGNLSNEFLKSCIFLAKLDPIIRSGWHQFNPQILEMDNEGDITDLRNLIAIVDFSLFKSKQISILNPTFGKGSSLVGGADADFIIDDKLIVIETTKKLAMSRSQVDQIIGCYLLTKIGGIDLAKGHKVNKIGLYFSRYAKLYEIPVSFIDENPKLPEFMIWFEKKAKKMVEKTKISKRILVE